MGWGEMMISTRLAERIAADNPDTVLTDQQKFDAAMSQVLSERAAGKGYGEIANENDLKVGRALGNVNRGSDTGSIQNNNRTQTHVKKQNVFGRFFSMLGFGKKEQAQNITKTEKMEKIERKEKPEKPEKPEKMERIETTSRPEKPEKPQGGPRR
jgi:hypothetical protein